MRADALIFVKFGADVPNYPLQNSRLINNLDLLILTAGEKGFNIANKLI
jgi:hypothetical protein